MRKWKVPEPTRKDFEGCCAASRTEPRVSVGPWSRLAPRSLLAPCSPRQAPAQIRPRANVRARRRPPPSTAQSIAGYSRRAGFPDGGHRPRRSPHQVSMMVRACSMPVNQRSLRHSSRRRYVELERRHVQSGSSVPIKIRPVQGEVDYSFQLSAYA